MDGGGGIISALKALYKFEPTQYFSNPLCTFIHDIIMIKVIIWIIKTKDMSTEETDSVTSQAVYHSFHKKNFPL